MPEKIDVVSLITAGRTGSLFLLSLIDNHPQVSVIPTELKFHQTWDHLGCSSLDTPDKMADAWMRHSKLAIMRNDQRWAGYDFKAFHFRWVQLLFNEGLSRSRVFLSLHQAYEEVAGRLHGKYRVIVEFSSHPHFAHHLLEDFPSARFIQVVRDYRGNYASVKQKIINLNGGLFERHGLRIRHALPDVLDFLLERAEAAASLQARVGTNCWRILSNVDLHLNNSATMISLAEWLGIDYTDTLRRSTINGIEWEGNSSFGEKFSGTSTNVLDRWRSKISENEARLVDYIFYDYQLAAGFQPECCVVHDSFWRRFSALLGPVSGEFSYRPPQNAPEGIVLRTVAKYFSPMGKILRKMRGPLFILALFLLYPVVRAKLWRRVQASRRRNLARNFRTV